MREIKFRAWDVYKKKFIPTTVWALPSEPTHREIGVMTQDWEDYKEGESFYPEHQSVMQFTGLKDKNGKEIYESDYVKLMEWEDNPDIYRIHPVTYRVDWDEDYAKFEMYSPDELWGLLPNGKPRETDEGIEIFRDFKPDEQIIEIIGNIYENPELLTS